MTQKRDALGVILRLTGWIIAVMAVASVPAYAEWKEYAFADLGIEKDFPSEPKIEDGIYQSEILGDVPARIFTASEQGVKYKMTIVAIPKARMGASASVMGECNFDALLAGKKVISDLPAEKPLGKQTVYGRLASVTQPDDTRSLTACYSTRGKLYRIQANFPASTPDVPNSPDALRFVNGFQFIAAN